MTGRIVRRYTAAYGLHWFEEVDVAVTVNEARASSYHRAKALIAELEPKIDEMLLAGGRTFDCPELSEDVRDAVAEVYEINGWLVTLDDTSIGFWEEW
jgi:hypothetical protein